MEKVNEVYAKIEGAGFTWLGIACAICILAGILIGLSRGLLKEVVSLVIVFVSLALVWFLNPYVNHFIKEVTPLESQIIDRTREAIEQKFDTGQVIKGGEQTEIIQNLGLPRFLTESLLKNNNAEGYRSLNVSSFVDYVSKYIAEVITNGLSFLLTFLMVSILLRILVFVLDIFTRLPVIHEMNKLGGAVLGGAKYVIFIWIAMLAATVFCSTSAGKFILDMIEQDRFLKMLYSWNLILKFFIKTV